jgi:transposase
VLELGNQQCPEPPRPPGKKGRIKKSNARNLLERLDQYQDDVLRFMTHPLVPFTNNLAERNLRMIKVHQKISGCFRSWDGAKAFCRIRSYLSTCQKHNYSPTLALTLLFNAQLPTFVTSLQHTAE